MSFKTFICSTDGSPTPIPPEGWDTVGNTLLVTDEFTLGLYFVCDSQLSRFYGAAPLRTGMTDIEFYIVWGGCASILVLGAIARRLRYAVLQ